MLGKWAVPVIVSILILGTLGIPHSFAQLCPVTGCLTDNFYVSDFGFNTVRQYDSTGALLNANFVTGLSDPRFIAFDTLQIPIGGTYIPIDQTALLLAGVQSISMWMIPVILAGIGIGVFVVIRRK